MVTEVSSNHDAHQISRLCRYGPKARVSLALVAPFYTRVGQLGLEIVVPGEWREVGRGTLKIEHGHSYCSI